MLVEDELLIALMAQDMLTDLGHQVVVAHDVQGALALLAEGAFDLAILDVNLSGSTSEPVADALLKAGTPYLFVTGYGAQGLPVAHQSRPVLPKPYDELSLDRAIRSIQSE